MTLQFRHMNELETKPPLGKTQILFQRLASTFVLWCVVLAALFAPFPRLALTCFLIIMLTVTVIGFLEIQDLCLKQGLKLFKTTGLIIACSLTLTGFFVGSGLLNQVEWLILVPGFGMVALLSCCIFIKDLSTALPAVAGTLFALLYVSGLLGFLQFFYFHPKWQGHYLLLYFILIIKFSDVGAYCVGSLVGKHKMIPRISPGKTWEGFAGALLIPGLLSALLVHWFPERMEWFSWPVSFFAGVLLGASALVGDLVESVFKRGADVKDSGSWFPGIGGVLDLVDSLLYSGPVMYALLLLK